MPVYSKAKFEIFKGGVSCVPQYFWRLRAPNNRIIACGGEGYSTRNKAHQALVRMANYANWAHVVQKK